jgi:hypothetical protein
MTEARPPLARGHQIAIQDATRLLETGGYEQLSVLAIFERSQR